MRPIEQAVAAVGGKQSELASRIGVTPQALGQWVSDSRPVPPERCPAIEKETGVRCEQLRPDVHWTRDQSGQVTGYHVPLNPTA